MVTAILPAIGPILEALGVAGAGALAAYGAIKFGPEVASQIASLVGSDQVTLNGLAAQLQEAGGALSPEVASGLYGQYHTLASLQAMSTLENYIANPSTDPAINQCVLNSVITAANQGLVDKTMSDRVIVAGLEASGFPAMEAAAAVPEAAAIEAAAAVPGAYALPGGAVTAGSWASAMGLAGTSFAGAMAANAQAIGHGMQQGQVMCMGTTGPQLLQKVLPYVMPIVADLAPLGIMAFLMNPTIRRELTDPITRTLFDYLLTMPEMGHPVRPSDAPGVARGVFMRAVGLGIGAHIASQVSEAAAPLKFMGLPYVAAMLADLAGFSRIAGATMGVLETQGIRVPMGYYINEKLRSVIPGVSDLRDMARERALVDPEEFNKLSLTDAGLDKLEAANRKAFERWVAYHGITPDLVDGLYETADRPAGYFLLRALADSGQYDELYFRRELLNSGYNLPTVRHTMDMLYAMAHGEIRPLYIGTVIKRYKEGLDSMEVLTTNLTMLGVRPELLPKYIYGAELERRYDDTMDYLATLKDAVRKGAIDPQGMEQLLVSAGMAPSKAAGYTLREAIRLIPARGS